MRLELNLKQKHVDRLIGDEDGFLLEHRLFNLILLLCSGGAILAFLKNVILTQNIAAMAITFCALLFFTLFYYFSRVRKKFDPLIPSFILTCLMVLPLSWSANFSIQGSIPYALVLLVSFFTILYTGRLRTIAISVLFLLILLLYATQNYFPKLPNAYQSSDIQYFDIVFVIVITLIVFYMFETTILNQYNNERNRNRSGLKKLELKNQQLTHQHKLQNNLYSLVKAHEEELESKQDQLQLINKILRHDIVNNLTAIRSCVNLYNDTGEQEYLNEIPKFVEKSGQLIQNMREIEFSLNEKNQAHRQNNKRRIRDIIRDVSAGYSGIDVQITGAINYLADAMMEPVVENLLSNARSHGNCTRVTIHISEVKDWHHISITNNGQRIPDNLIDSIFEENFTAGDAEHSGLGLFVVKCIIEKLKGEVTVKNIEPTGVVFNIRVPV